MPKFILSNSGAKKIYSGSTILFKTSCPGDRLILKQYSSMINMPVNKQYVISKLYNLNQVYRILYKTFKTIIQNRRNLKRCRDLQISIHNCIVFHTSVLLSKKSNKPWKWLSRNVNHIPAVDRLTTPDRTMPPWLGLKAD